MSNKKDKAPPTLPAGASREYDKSSDSNLGGPWPLKEDIIISNTHSPPKTKPPGKPGTPSEK